MARSLENEYLFGSRPLRLDWHGAKRRCIPLGRGPGLLDWYESERRCIPLGRGFKGSTGMEPGE